MIKIVPYQASTKSTQVIKVRVIKAPLVDNTILQEFISQRRKAIIL